MASVFSLLDTLKDELRLLCLQLSSRRHRHLRQIRHWNISNSAPVLLALFITRIDAYGGTRRIYKSNVRARKRNILRPNVKMDLSAIPLLNSIVSASHLLSAHGSVRIFVIGACKIFKLFAGDNLAGTGLLVSASASKFKQFPRLRAPLQQGSRNRLDNLERRLGFCECDSTDANVARARADAL